MIGYIEGTVLATDANRAIIKTHQGLGFEVTTAVATMPSKQVALYTSQIFREDQQQLFAFETFEDKKFFELLISVNGVGPKTAFNMIAYLGIQQIRRAILMEDSQTLKKTPGLGKKGADQVILSLKDKIAKMDVHQSAAVPSSGDLSVESNHLFQEALTACQSLGFKDQQVIPALTKLMAQTKFQNAEELLTQLLKEMR